MENCLNSKIHKKFGVKEAVALSLTLHFLGLFYVVDFSFDDIKIVEDKSEPKQVRIRLKNVKSLYKPKQIVNTVKSTNKKKNPKAKFLGEHTQSVDRQTTAAIIGNFKDAGLGIRNGVDKPVSGKKVTQQKKNTKKIKFSDLSFGKTVSKVMPSLAALGLKNGNKNLRGLSKNNDFIEEVPLGDMTSLNTIETKYYGFYHRIRLKLEQYWGDTLNKKVTSLYKRGRNIASETNHITSLKIEIDIEGNITNIHIKSTSGIRELDDAAIESFSKAGPFPNPPSGMIRDGFAVLEWGFVVKG